MERVGGKELTKVSSYSVSLEKPVIPSETQKNVVRNERVTFIYWRGTFDPKRPRTSVLEFPGYTDP